MVYTSGKELKNIVICQAYIKKLDVLKWYQFKKKRELRKWFDKNFNP